MDDRPNYVPPSQWAGDTWQEMREKMAALPDDDDALYEERQASGRLLLRMGRHPGPVATVKQKRRLLDRLRALMKRD